MKHFCAIAVAAIVFFFPATNVFAYDYSPITISIVPGVALPFGADRVGIALGSIGNISGRVDLLQAAGAFNIADDIRGLQAAGVFNIADETMEGIQAAGVFNIAGDVDGAQIAPVFNIADDVQGFQVGIVNVADRVTGIQLGLINISSNGVFELSGSWESQTEYVYGTLKTGNTSVFGVYSIGMPRGDWFKTPDNTVVSAGLGTRIGDSRSLHLDLEVSASQATGADLRGFFDAMNYRDGRSPSDVLAPWPTLDASLSLKLGGLRFTGGFRSDISLASAPNLPSGLAKGFSYSDTWFGEGFTAWTKWYIGLGF
ncbi:MAG TPA: hypothetical protein VN445_05795 [Rectinemataceae bacterium]|nr:hypothetical protein [Rectinemataceae bacterium]